MNPNFNRKGFLALTGGVSLAAFLAACGGGSDSGSSSAGGDAAATTAAAGAQGVFDPATEPGGPIEIFTWAGYDDTEGDGAPWMWADYQASEYGDHPYTITHKLVEDGRKHLLLRAPLAYAGRVRLLQGMQDKDVPWQWSLKIAEALTTPDVRVSLVKDGDHRLSRPEDIERLLAAVAEF